MTTLSGQISSRIGPLINTNRFEDTKDPCPVFDGVNWHMFGSAGSSRIEQWKILHATAPHFTGPWTEQEPAFLPISNPHMAAPGVIFDYEEKLFHMFVQTDFLALDGTVEHLTSKDGHMFNHVKTIMHSIPDSLRACIYDPHPAKIGEACYITYSGAPRVGRPDIYLLKSKSNTWYGPWEDMGVILKHEDVLHHNQHDHPDYEWGLEGSQVLQLRSGKILLNAVCFLPHGARGTRQRVFFSIADSVSGPYKSTGPILEPSEDGWDSGENGHATVFIHEERLYLFYQARPFKSENNNWRYGIAEFKEEEIVERIQMV